MILDTEFYIIYKYIKYNTFVVMNNFNNEHLHIRYFLNIEIIKTINYIYITYINVYIMHVYIYIYIYIYVHIIHRFIVYNKCKL